LIGLTHFVLLLDLYICEVDVAHSKLAVTAKIITNKGG